MILQSLLKVPCKRSFVILFGLYLFLMVPCATSAKTRSCDISHMANVTFVVATHPRSHLYVEMLLASMSEVANQTVIVYGGQNESAIERNASSGTYTISSKLKLFEYGSFVEMNNFSDSFKSACFAFLHDSTFVIDIRRFKCGISKACKMLLTKDFDFVYYGIPPNHWAYKNLGVAGRHFIPKIASLFHGRQAIGRREAIGLELKGIPKIGEISAVGKYVKQNSWVEPYSNCRRGFVFYDGVGLYKHHQRGQCGPYPAQASSLALSPSLYLKIGRKLAKN